MPLNRAVRPGNPSPIRQQAPPPPFVFPSSHHLAIATQKRVLQWDAAGLHDAFTSETSGILTAKESRDGSGLLAIADSQIVLLHDELRGKDRTYNLKSTDGQVRLLEFTNDSSTLFFTTTLQTAIQSYSLKESRILDPGYTHPSPPTVLAISPTSHLLLSASEAPPIIYLQNLTLKTPPLQLQPRASSAAVTVAAFHPDRPNIFLLGFKDGTLAAYDATRFLRDSKTDAKSASKYISRGSEIGHFNALHLVTNKEKSGDSTTAIGSRSIGITGASFMPGSKTKAVSVGGDGKCRIVDFGLGGNILRTWHIRAPATSMTISQVRTMQAPIVPRTPRRAAGRGTRSGDDSVGVEVKKNIIAVGRQDGKVLLFDEVGILLEEKTADEEAGMVLSVEWINHPVSEVPRKAASRGVTVEEEDFVQSTLHKKRRKSAFGKRKSNVRMSNVGLSVLDVVEAAAVIVSSYEQASEELYAEMGTVNYNPIEGTIHRDLPPVQNAKYMDLFSPVKQLPVPQSPAPYSPFSPQGRSTRSRPRPRIRSSTFVSNSEQSSPTKSPLKISGTQVITEPEEEAVPEEAKDDEAQNGEPQYDLQEQRPSSPTQSPSSTKRFRIGRPPYRNIPGTNLNLQSSKHSITSNSSSASANSQVLANLRRFAETGRMGSGSNNLALFAPYINSKKPTPGQSSYNHVSSDGEGHEQDPFQVGKKAPTVIKEEGREDIWLTSDEEGSPPGHGRAHHHRRGGRHNRNPSTDEDNLTTVPSNDGDSEQDDDTGNQQQSAYHSHNPAAPHLTAPHLPRPTSSRSLHAKEVEEEEYDVQACVCGSACCAHLRSELQELREEMEQMRSAMAAFMAVQRRG